MKYLLAASSLVLYLTIYVFMYVVHVKFFQVDVVFYSALADAVVALLVTALMLLPFRRLHERFTGLEKAQMAALWLAAGYIAAISVPTVFDRSLSFYILEKLQQQGGSLPKEDFEHLFTVGYAREHRLVDVRLTEQLASGTVTLHDGCVSLTPRGRSLASMSRYFRLNLLPKRRLLMDEYTDVLTDPFRESRLPETGASGGCVHPDAPSPTG